MKLCPLCVTATFALVATAAPGVTRGAQEEVLLPEVNVRSQSVDRPHPQDNTYSDRPLGCVETATPSGTGNELGGYFLARNAKEGIPVIPSLNDPSSASEFGKRHDYVQHQATPAGQEGKPGCNR